MRGKAILLRGNYAEGNFGDDALLLAAHELLARHASRIAVEGGAAYRDKRLTMLEEPLPSGRRFAPIVYGGGTQFFSFGDGEPQKGCAPLLTRLLRKMARPASLIESYRMRRRTWLEKRTPRIAIGFGVGPFPENSPGEAAAARILRPMALVWVRDRASEAFCLKHGIEQAVLSSDLCFTSAFAGAVKEPAPAAPDGDRPLRIGIVLRDWPSLDGGFFEAAIEAGRRLRQSNVTVVFFSFSPRDARLLAALERHGEKAAAWGPGAGPIESYWTKLAQMDLIVTARFHGAVFALLSRIPFLAIAIEPKLALLKNWAAAAPGPPNGIAIPPALDPGSMAHRILAALEQLPLRRAQAGEMLGLQRRRAETGVNRLDRFFETAGY